MAKYAEGLTFIPEVLGSSPTRAHVFCGVFSLAIACVFFVNRPSNMRMIQCYMSKTCPISTYFNADQVALAKSLYLKAIRDAASVVLGSAVKKAATQNGSPPQKKLKGVFRGMGQSPGTVAIPQLMMAAGADGAAAAAVAGGGGSGGDAVTDEISRWSMLPEAHMEEFYDDTGFLNEFALMYSLRNKFPLHYSARPHPTCPTRASPRTPYRRRACSPTRTSSRPFSRRGPPLGRAPRSSSRPSRQSGSATSPNSARRVDSKRRRMDLSGSSPRPHPRRRPHRHPHRRPHRRPNCEVRRRES